MATVQGQAATGASNPMERLKSLHFLQTPATDVGKADTRRYRNAKLWMQHAEDVERKDTMRRFCLKGKCSTHSLEAPQANSTGAGVGEPLYFNDEGQPVYTYLVSVPQVNKHLIKFPIALEPSILRSNRNNMSSPQSTQSVLLSLMNRKHLTNSLEEPKKC